MIPGSTILGYHGCSEALARRVVLREDVLRPSSNGNDWLGSGVYFWAYDPGRAYEWAAINLPADLTVAVLGAVIDLGNCLNLSERTAVEQVSEAHRYLRESLVMEGREAELPRNRDGNRLLDFKVMETLHALREEQKRHADDTVIGYFGEGSPIYEGAELRHQNHLQICVRRPEAMVGYFLPVPTVRGF